MLEAKTWLALAVAALSGAAMSFQGAFNTAASRRLGLVTTSLVVHGIGVVLTALIIVAGIAVARHHAPQASAFSQVPWFGYLGGVLSVGIIAGVAYAFPRTGAGLGVALIVSAQLVAALALDHFGWFEMKRVPADWVRLLGAVLLIVGTRLVAR